MGRRPAWQFPVDSDFISQRAGRTGLDSRTTAQTMGERSHSLVFKILQAPWRAALEAEQAAIAIARLNETQML